MLQKMSLLTPTKSMKVSKRLNILIGLLLTLLVSCQEKLTPLEYKQWAESEESGLVKQKEVNGLTFRAQYKTREYSVLLQKGPRGIENCDIEKEVAAISEDHQILLTIDNSENGTPPLEHEIYDERDYYARLQYLTSGEVSKDCFLLTEQKDTVPCALSHFERDFGIGPKLNLSLAFDRSRVPENERIQLCFKDRMFNRGMIKFIFEKESINELPLLVLN